MIIGVILYSEHELRTAYRKYVATFKETPNLTIPNLREFREIYEEYWYYYFNDEQKGRTH